MCDLNDIIKILLQYLIINDFYFVVNDFDVLLEVKVDEGELIKCGYRELYGDFVVFEQLWFYLRFFDDEEMFFYDEKIDIWRIFNVFDKLLG